MGRHLIYFILPRMLPPQHNGLFDPDNEIVRHLFRGPSNTQAYLSSIAGAISVLTGLKHSVDRDKRRSEWYRVLPLVWTDEPLDVLNPFVDNDWGSSNTEVFWVLDLRKDVLQYVDRDGRRCLPIADLTPKATLGDLKDDGPACPPYLEPSLEFERPFWKPNIDIDPRLRALLHRLLRDFDYRSRHVLAAECGDLTLKLLANIVLRICTLRFRATEDVQLATRKGLMCEFSELKGLPRWNELQDDCLQVGCVLVIIRTSLQDGLTEARARLQSQEVMTTVDDPNAVQALLLSVRAVALCRATSTGSLECTAPEPLFNGGLGGVFPSDLALDYLLHATATARELVQPPMKAWPLELQDLVLSHFGGPIAAAQMGCVLGLGTSFSWKDRSRDLELQKWTGLMDRACRASSVRNSVRKLLRWSRICNFAT